VEVPGTGATQASLHTADLLPAVLESFVLDLAARQLQMTFSDVIDVSTYSSTSLTVQNAVSADGDASKSYQLSGGVISSGDTKFVTVDLAVADFVALGENGLLGTEVNNTFISMLASAFDDTSSRGASVVTNGGAVQAKVVVPDVTPPTLVSSTLELSSDKLVLSFSEPLNYSSFESTVISLQSQANRTAGGESRAISSSNATRNADRNIFSVLLEADDLNAIKLADSLAVSSTSTFIAFSSALVVDLGGVAGRARHNRHSTAKTWNPMETKGGHRATTESEQHACSESAPPQRAQRHELEGIPRRPTTVRTVRR
jgi:hypothetical protein